MSGRHKRSEKLWEKMTPAEICRGSSPKRSNSEAVDFGRTSWDRNDDDISRGRPRKQTDTSFNDKCARPSDDRYNQPYRSRDRSRSRGREWESRSPFYEDRHKSNDSRNNSRVCKDFVAGDCRKGRHCRFFHQDYSRGSKYSDYRNSDRSMDYDTHRKGNQLSNDFIKGRSDRGSPHHDDRKPYQSSRLPCKFFIAGNCNRDNCKFSHDGPDPRSHDNHNSGNVLADMSKSSFGDKNKSWDGPSWNDVESGGFDERSRDNVLSDDKNRTWDHPVSDDKKKLWDGPSWDNLDSQGFGDRNGSVLSADKHRTWGLPVSEKKLCDERSRDNNGSVLSDYKNRTRDRPVFRHDSDDKKKAWDDHDSQGFDERSRDNVLFNDKNRAWSRRNSDDKEKLCDERPRDKIGNVVCDDMKRWDGPSWDDLDVRSNNVLPEVSEKKLFDEKSCDKNGSVLSDDKDRTRVSRHNSDDKEKLWDGRSRDKKWDGPSWDDLDVRSRDNNANLLSDDMNTTSVSGDEKKKLWDDSNLNNSNVVSEDANQQILTCGKDSMDSQPKNDEKGQLANLTKAIDYLESLPKSAYSQEGNIGNGEKEGERKVEEGNTGNGEKEGEGKVEEGNVGNEEKLMRQFKIGLVEVVKEILKPKWKEGKMGREVYKTVVKKVVDKVTTSIQGIQIPRTQPKIDQYLATSKPKITKLVEAYVEKLLKA